VGEIEEVTAEELENVAGAANQISMAGVTDIVKVPIHLDITVFEETQSTDTYLYIGKYNGEFRIIYTDAMENL